MKRIAIASIACLWASLAFGQANNSNTWATPGNQTVGGVVQMCPNASGIAVPCSSPIAGSGNAGYPPGATPASASATGTTGLVSAALNGTAGKFTYVCGFQVSFAGTGGTSGPVTLTNVVGGQMIFQLPAVAASAPVNFSQTFTPCITTAVVNTAIAAVTTANATGTAVDVQIWGYMQ